MTKKTISPEDLMREVSAVRASDLSVYACPMCKADGAWHYDGNTNYMLARSSGKADLTGDEISHQIVAHTGDQLTRADCGKCGFVALFKRGFGPQ